MILTLCKYFLWYILYSFAGWTIETLLFLIRDKKVVKRGFLFGPLCPIYGTGAVLCIFALYGRINNIFLVFITGLLLCGSLEYITHFIMEKLFHAMWWDYSSRRFNIKGRVYLNGLLLFGAGATLIVKLIQPFVEKLTNMLSDNTIYITSFILYTLIIIDVTATIVDLAGIVKVIKEAQNYIITHTQQGIDFTEEHIESFADIIKGSDIYRSLKKDDTIIKRMQTRYPNLTLKRYKKFIDIVLDKPQEEKARKDIKLYGTAETIPNPEDENK